MSNIFIICIIELVRNNVNAKKIIDIKISTLINQSIFYLKLKEQYQIFFCFLNSILQCWFYGTSIIILPLYWQKFQEGFCHLGAKFLMPVSYNQHYTIFFCTFCLTFLITVIKPNVEKIKSNSKETRKICLLNVSALVVVHILFSTCFVLHVLGSGHTQQAYFIFFVLLL